jgi:predicted PurR-regulated permease PerM
MQNESLIPKTNISTVFFGLASLTLIILGLIYFDSIFKPLSIAFLIWFMIKQLKDSMGKISIRGKKLPSGVRSILAFIIILVALFFITEILIENLENLIALMPQYLSKFDTVIIEVSEIFNNPKYSEYLQKWLEGINLSGMATVLLDSLTGIVSNSAVVIVYVVFFLLEETNTRLRFDKLFTIKGQQYANFMDNLNRINESIRSYISSKTIISLITGAVSYIILLLMHVDNAFLWSFLIFILNFIPYIGPLISSLLPALFAVIVTGEFMQFVYVFAAMEIVQIIIGNFIEPMVMGKGTNLGPITVIIALAFWGMIWGMVGMILAVPVTSVFVIILSQISSTRYIAVLLSEKGNIPDFKN